MQVLLEKRSFLHYSFLDWLLQNKISQEQEKELEETEDVAIE
jgi:hypothetical protein